MHRAVVHMLVGSNVTTRVHSLFIGHSEHPNRTVYASQKSNVDDSHSTILFAVIRLYE